MRTLFITITILAMLTMVVMNEYYGYGALDFKIEQLEIEKKQLEAKADSIQLENDHFQNFIIWRAQHDTQILNAYYHYCTLSTNE